MLLFSPLTAKSVKNQNSKKKKFPNVSLKTLKTQWYHAKVWLKRINLSGYTTGFCRMTRKLELNFMLHSLLKESEGLKPLNFQECHVRCN